LQHCSKKQILFKPRIIQKIIAAFMVVVFAFSITPTIVFHNWMADHSDTVRKSNETKGEQLGKQTFNCHCDNIVAESPFTGITQTIINHPAQPLSSAKVDLQVHFISSQQFLYSLRGPPTV
jgi:hypothetical protein